MKKSILIKEEIHSQIKKYCDKNGLKLNKLIESLIINYIKDGEDKENKKY
jgi:hypothetical protein